MAANAKAERVCASSVDEARKTLKEQGPLIDLRTAAAILGVSRTQVERLWHSCAFRQFVVLGAFMVRLVEVEMRRRRMARRGKVGVGHGG